jgi:hypothetical protein
MRKTTMGAHKAVTPGTPTPTVVAVNAAGAAFVDELLRLPSPSAAATVVDLLYGRQHPAPTALLTHVNGGIHIPLAALLSSSTPLVVPLADRLRVSSAWRADGQALKGARAAARARYRELQTAFVSSATLAPREPAAALVRYTFGWDGRQWLWEETAARVLHRVASLNRAMLDLLAAASRGETPTDGLLPHATFSLTEFDLPETALDLMAAALPPVAVPDWSRFAAALEGSQAPLNDDEAVRRYRSLLAEILGLQSHQEIPA